MARVPLEDLPSNLVPASDLPSSIVPEDDLPTSILKKERSMTEKIRSWFKFSC